MYKILMIFRALEYETGLQNIWRWKTPKPGLPYLAYLGSHVRELVSVRVAKQKCSSPVA